MGTTSLSLFSRTERLIHCQTSGPGKWTSSSLLSLISTSPRAEGTKGWRETGFGRMAGPLPPHARRLHSEMLLTRWAGDWLTGQSSPAPLCRKQWRKGQQSHAKARTASTQNPDLPPRRCGGGFGNVPQRCPGKDTVLSSVLDNPQGPSRQ